MSRRNPFSHSKKTRKHDAPGQAAFDFGFCAVCMSDVPPGQDTSRALHGLTLAEIVTIEPRLRAVAQLALTLQTRKVEINDIWYQSIRPRIRLLVGWEAEQPLLRSSSAYKTVYDAFYSTICEHPMPQNGKERKRRRARSFLRSALSLGPRPAAQLQQEWQTAGFTDYSMEQASKGMVRVRRQGGRHGCWTWELRHPSEVDHLEFDTPLYDVFGLDL